MKLGSTLNKLFVIELLNFDNELVDVFNFIVGPLYGCFDDGEIRINSTYIWILCIKRYNFRIIY